MVHFNYIVPTNISTHSLTRRLTFCLTSKTMPNSYFNSQPHKEADVSYQTCEPDSRYFNSQPHKEADNGGVLIECSISYFNSQPHKEADLSVVIQYQIVATFQLTASQGG